MRKALGLLVVFILVFGVVASGCINGSENASMGISTAPSSQTSSISAQSSGVVLTLVGPNGEKKELTLDDLKKLPQTEGKGGLKTKTGTIKNVGTYRGVSLEELVKLVNGLSGDYHYVITAADGYSVSVDYDFLQGNGIDTMDENGNSVSGNVMPILAYEFNGGPIEFELDGEVYPLELALVSEKGYVTPGNFWVKAVVKIEVVKASTGSSSGAQTTGYVTVQDFRNRTVKVKQPVERIVSLYGLATQMVYLLGDGQKVLGSTPLAMNDGFIQLIDPEVKNRMVFVGSPKSANIETVKELNPDVVFTAAWGDERLNEGIETLGIPVIALDLETVDNYLKSLEIMGKVLGKEERAKEAVEYYRNALKVVTEGTASLSEGGRPRVLLVMYSMKSKAFKVPGQDYFQNRLIEMAGGISVSKELPGGWNVVNVEQIASWDPDIIIVVSYSLQYPSTKVKEDIMNDPAWQGIRAVKEGKIYAMPNDGESWDYPAPKWILGLYWTAKVLHPELFSDLDIEKEANDLYERFYGLSIEDVTIVGDMP